MGPQPSEIAISLSQKYQALHEAFNALAAEATRYQSTLPLDSKDRGLFNSLSRIVAFSDHVHVALNLMSEDVKSIHATYCDETVSEWMDIEEGFDEWFTSLCVANVKVH